MSCPPWACFNETMEHTAHTARASRAGAPEGWPAPPATQPIKHEEACLTPAELRAWLRHWGEWHASSLRKWTRPDAEGGFADSGRLSPLARSRDGQPRAFTPHDQQVMASIASLKAERLGAEAIRQRLRGGYRLSALPPVALTPDQVAEIKRLQHALRSTRRLHEAVERWRGVAAGLSIAGLGLLFLLAALLLGGG
ncbi:MAG: hypothetical protein GYB64_13860 [Chloroflexi bacterium]|nr:hypothetical protein [Chloroflexota bacterium]